MGWESYILGVSTVFGREGADWGSSILRLVFVRMRNERAVYHYKHLSPVSAEESSMPSKFFETFSPVSKTGIVHKISPQTEYDGKHLAIREKTSDPALPSSSQYGHEPQKTKNTISQISLPNDTQQNKPAHHSLPPERKKRHRSLDRSVGKSSFFPVKWVTVAAWYLLLRSHYLYQIDDEWNLNDCLLGVAL